MQELSTKVKKNNFIQNIRLGYYRRKANKNLTIDELLKLPPYIQNDGQILSTLRLFRNIPDSEWRKLDLDILLRHDGLLGVINQEFFLGYSDEQQYSFLNSGKVDLSFCDRNTIEEIVTRLIKRGFYDVLKLNLGKNQQHEFNQSILKKLREKNNEEMILPNIIKYLDMSSINSIISSNPQLIQLLDKQQQFDIIETQKDKLAFLTQEVQKECIEKNIEFFKYASVDVKKGLLKQDIDMFKKIDYDSQMELISYDSRLYILLPYESKQKMLNDFNEIDEAKINSKVIKSALTMVKKDVNNMKYFNVDNPSPNAFKLFDGLESLDIDIIKEYVLHSKICGAIGKLTGADFLMHGQSGGEAINGIDSYNQEQIDFINKLTAKQAKELIQIDTNYILPYLADSKWIIDDKFVLKNYDDSKDRCTKLFLELYGKEKLEQYSKSIDLIYDMQKKYDMIAKERYNTGIKPVSNYEVFNKQGEIPLEEFKILFNEKIINSCDSKEIEEYLTEIAEGGKLASEKFVNIIGKAYGVEAKEIIKSRPELNVHSINSLEVFDSRILGRYGEAFVHDCISYNLRDFSEFLDAIKDEKQCDNFYEYYEALCNIYGRNVETMQKAMSEYSYVKDIIENVKNKDLTEKQTMNLLNVFCTKRNEFNIRTIEELENFDQIANSKMLREIGEINISADNAADIVKQIICSNLLGMEYEDNNSLNYGKSLQTLTTLYDFGTDEISKTQYSEEEKRFMEILYFISNELDPKKLTEFAKNTTELSNIRNLVTINNVIDKVIEKETHELTDSLTSIEKIREICKEQEGKENPQAYYEEVDGLQVFHLNGMDYCMFSHDLGTLSYEDWLRYEGQGGNSAICSRVVKGNMGDTSGKYLFGELPKEGLIVIGGRDANTQHVPKRVRSYANQQISIKNITDIKESDNEVAFYRRQRSHEYISNESAGGRIKPMAYGISDISQIQERQKKLLIDNGIPIIIVHRDKYNTKETISNVKKEESERT